MKRSNPYKAVIPIVSGIAYVPNPRPHPEQPLEVTVRSERIGTLGRDLAPGVRLISQISQTEKEVWVTHGEERLFVLLQDGLGRSSYFYQSFSGTGGKAQGAWFPSGGILADRQGRGVWVIKGSPKTDPGAGRAALLELYEKANAVLPQSDADTDRFVKKLTGVGFDEDFTYKDAYAIKPVLRILEDGSARDLQAKWGSWSYQFWALNALDKTFGKRTFNMKSNPLVGFERVPWKPGNSPRSEATFLSAAYPRLWEEALKNTALKIRVLIARDEDSMGDIGKNLLSIDAAAKRGGEIVILVLALSRSSSYALEEMISESKPKVGDPQRLSRPTPFMIMHNFAEDLMNAMDGAYYWLPDYPENVHTWAGRRGALTDSGQAMADIFAAYVVTGRFAYSAPDEAEVKKTLAKMLVRLTPGTYVLSGDPWNMPLEADDIATLSEPARKNPTDLAGRHIPDRYLAGLPPALQKQRVRELTESRDAYKRGDYSELATDVTARKMGLVKESSYTTEAKKRGISYRGDFHDMAKRTLKFYSGRAPAREVEAFAEALRKSFSKGLSAWKSGGHRPGATAQNWAVARVNSLVVGGKTSWTADKKLFEVLPESVQAKVESMRAKSNPLTKAATRDYINKYRVEYGSTATVAERIMRSAQRGTQDMIQTRGSAATRRPQAAKDMAATSALAQYDYLLGNLDDAEILNLMKLEAKGGTLTSEEKSAMSKIQDKIYEVWARSAGQRQGAAHKARLAEELGVVGRGAGQRSAQKFYRDEAAARSAILLVDEGVAQRGGKKKGVTPARIAAQMKMTLEKYNEMLALNQKSSYSQYETTPLAELGTTTQGEHLAEEIKAQEQTQAAILAARGLLVEYPFVPGYPRDPEAVALSLLIDSLKEGREVDDVGAALALASGLKLDKARALLAKVGQSARLLLEDPWEAAALEAELAALPVQGQKLLSNRGRRG